MGSEVLALKLAHVRYVQGAIQTNVTTGNNDYATTLATGTSKQFLKRVRVALPAGIGDITIQFFDNTVATNAPVTGALYLAAQPASGFDLSGLQLTSGILGYRIAGWTAGNASAYLNIEYTY